jgi:hypothetical protein
MAYLLDANVLIAAKNLHYGLDFCPGFWDWLEQGHDAEKVLSVEKVGDEVASGDDELSEWAASLPKGFFLTPSAATLTSLAEVSRWVNDQDYEPSAITTFLSVADAYLVAEAHAGEHTVVTHEQPASSTKRIKIPNVCVGLKVKYLTPFEMLRRERARLVLGGNA